MQQQLHIPTRSYSRYAKIFLSFLFLLPVRPSWANAVPASGTTLTDSSLSGKLVDVLGVPDDNGTTLQMYCATSLLLISAASSRSSVASVTNARVSFFSSKLWPRWRGVSISLTELQHIFSRYVSLVDHHSLACRFIVLLP
jgi:hypothetical protein